MHVGLTRLFTLVAAFYVDERPGQTINAAQQSDSFVFRPIVPVKREQKRAQKPLKMLKLLDLLFIHDIISYSSVTDSQSTIDRTTMEISTDLSGQRLSVEMFFEILSKVRF